MHEQFFQAPERHKAIVGVFCCLSLQAPKGQAQTKEEGFSTVLTFWSNGQDNKGSSLSGATLCSYHLLSHSKPTSNAGRPAGIAKPEGLLKMQLSQPLPAVCHFSAAH